jgi:hypothetical protein
MNKKNRTFGLSVGGVLLAYAAARYILKGEGNEILACVGLCLLLFALLKPKWLTPLRYVWEKIGFVLGTVNTYVFLTIFYFVVLTPIGLLRRLTSKRVRFPSLDATTYWQVPSSNDDNQFKNQY